MRDFQTLTTSWNGSWPETIRLAEDQIQELQQMARSTYGFKAWHRTSPVSWSDFKATGEADLYPYAVVNWVVLRPTGKVDIITYLIVIGSMPTGG
mgnify:CR=1 FL=1